MKNVVLLCDNQDSRTTHQFRSEASTGEIVDKIFEECAVPDEAIRVNITIEEIPQEVLDQEEAARQEQEKAVAEQKQRLEEQKAARAKKK